MNIAVLLAALGMLSACGSEPLILQPVVAPSPVCECSCPYVAPSPQPEELPHSHPAHGHGGHRSGSEN